MCSPIVEVWHDVVERTYVIGGISGASETWKAHLINEKPRSSPTNTYPDRDPDPPLTAVHSF